MLIRMLLTFLFSVSTLPVWAADPPKPATADKVEEFAKLNKEWKDLVAKLGSLKIEYNTVTDSAKKEGIRKQFDEGRARAESMLPNLVAAAEGAYAESPNTDKNTTEILLGMLADAVRRDDYETGFRIGKILMDHKCPEKLVPALAGVAAYCVNEYTLADSWLRTAQASGALEEISKEMQRANYAQYPELVDETKVQWTKEKKIREAEAKANDLPRATLKTTQGDIEIELFENEAPNAVLNFITLVDKGFYNGLKFHRVLPGFMAQGGDPKGDGSGGPGYTIPCECYQADHRLHFRGTLSMAHAGRDTGGSQFFLTFVPTKHLDGKHTAFGRVINGFDVLAKLKRRDPDGSTVGPADRIVEAKVTRRRSHPYDANDVKKSGKGD
jgi:cyclophilin family peptidyl-prolyl cis-trans isomerase